MKESKITFGFWVYLMSDCVLFAALFATYAVLQHQVAQGSAMYDLVSLPFVFTETILLLTSSFTVGLALLAARHGKKEWTLLLLAITALLGAAFLAMELQEFMHLVAQGHGPAQSAFLSAFFTLVGTHGLHVLVGTLWMLAVMGHILWRGTHRSLSKLACLSLFWHFLDVVWIFIFTFVYLFGTLAIL